MAINYLYFGLLATMLFLAGCVAQPTGNGNQTIPSANDTVLPANNTTQSANDTALSTNNTTQTANDTVLPINDTIKPAVDTSKTIQVEMTAENSEFIPSTIEARKGQTVKLIVTNKDATMIFELPSHGQSFVRLNTNEPVTMEFNTTDVGEFPFWNSLNQEMRGMLIVTE